LVFLVYKLYINNETALRLYGKGVAWRPRRLKPVSNPAITNSRKIGGGRTSCFACACEAACFFFRLEKVYLVLCEAKVFLFPLLTPIPHRTTPRLALGRNRVAPNSTSCLSWGWLARPVLASRLRSRAAPGVVTRCSICRSPRKLKTPTYT